MVSLCLSVFILPDLERQIIKFKIEVTENSTSAFHCTIVSIKGYILTPIFQNLLYLRDMKLAGLYHSCHPFPAFF